MLLKDLIAQYRAANNLSQRAFAAKCDVTNGYISMLENGKNPSTEKPIVPSLAKLTKIANGMDMSVQQLLQIVDDMDVDISGTDNDAFSPSAMRIAAVYDSTSDQGRELLNTIAAFVENNF